MITEIDLMLEKASKERIRYFPIGTFLGLLAVLFLVAALGLLAYRKLDLIVKTAAEANQPDDRLLLVREVVSDIYDAENGAIMYSLGRDEHQLLPYHEAVDSMNGKLEKLLALPNTDSTAQGHSLRLSALVNEKLLLLHAQLDLQQYNRTDEVLDELSSNLKKAIRPLTPQPSKSGADKGDSSGAVTTLEEPKPTAISPDEQRERTNEFYRWMLGMETTKDQKPAPKDSVKVAAKPILPAPKTQETPPKPKHTVVLPASIELELDALQKAEANRYRESLERDLALTLRSQEVSRDIRDVVIAIEQHERKSMATKSLEMAKIADAANSWIIFFCIALSVFLLLLTIGIIAYFRSTKRHQESIVTAKTAAEELADARARFLATMTHEIRTPMNAIVGFTRQLMKSPLLPTQMAHQTLVQKAADHLLGIVNTVLDYSRLDAGQMQYEQRDFDLEKEIELVLSLLRPQFEAKGIALNWQWNDAHPKNMKGDPLRLRQVLLNLLSNSLKFTTHGAVHLELELVSPEGAQPQMRFTVRDTGMGIPAERLDAVFKAFEQSDVSISRKFGGSGLGLAITKMLVEQQGGSIGIDSEPGSGTTVWFEMPFGIGNPEAARDVSDPIHATHSFKGKVALIADDEPFNRKLLREILENWEMHCTEVGTGRAAVDAAHESQFDFIFMDLRMPDMDGLEATRRIRTAGLCTTSPIVVVSASAEETAIAACLSAGCNVVLGKPFSEDALLEHLIGMEQAHIGPLKVPPVQVVNGPKFSLEGLRRMGRQDERFVQEMVQGFIDAAQHGKKVIQLGFDVGDHQAIAEASHKLAGPAKHIAAMGLYRVLKQLETAGLEESDWEDIACILPQLEDELNTLLPALMEVLTHDRQLS
jgi:signal transduction histidine kinase/ActR/RegA family two-component response regulator/HPt (histidine-containing phosphotransfer) domain-containing protein